ncbi:MAG: translation initiation factor IF-2 [Candidatus Aminicenantaceae bacterium]
MEKKDTKKKAKKEVKTKDEKVKKIYIGEGSSLKDLSDKLEIKGKDIVNKLNAKGFYTGLNDVVNKSIAENISKELDISIEIVPVEKQAQQRAESEKEKMIERPPVVTMMGHVDHGKTTLLDAIRKSHIVNKESGGITQHIGAYKISFNNRFITFIDTPGHSAFTQLRSRGAQITDIVVLVVAADDGVKPQTKEAINHAKAANVPILIAINKIDKESIDLDRVKQQLSKEGLLIEDWGGDIISVEVSAKEKTNLKELLEMILLLSDVTEIKGNPEGPAQGIILEARLDSKKGPVATVVIQQGTLYQGDAFLSGTCCGKVKAMFDENNNRLKQAELSSPVEVLGFSNVPIAGDYFQVMSDLECARQIVSHRKSQMKKETTRRPEHLSLDELFKKIEEGEVKELPLIIKADVQGSLDTLTEILPKLSTKEVKINIIHSSTGNITESDVLLASASNAIIIGYNIKPNQKIIDQSKEENIEIRSYKVIYHLTDDIKKAISGMIEPELKESYIGRAEVRRIFKIPRVGTIAGCYVTDGKITRKSKIKVKRDDEIIYEGKVSSLKHLKENYNEVNKDLECGIGLGKFKDIKEGDILEAYTIEEIKQ